MNDLEKFADRLRDALLLRVDADEINSFEDFLDEAHNVIEGMRDEFSSKLEDEF